MTAYLGFDVLEAPPNSREDQSDTLQRRILPFDPGLGKRSILLPGQAGLAKPYLWTCVGKAQVVAFKAWLDARHGQAVPFWIPSWRQDLLLAEGMTAVDGGASILPCGYTLHAFPSKARRHLAIFYGANVAYRSVLAASDLGDHESLTLSGSPGFALPKGAWLCYLHLVRLASDELEIVWHTDELAECSFPYLEVPEEAP